MIRDNEKHIPKEKVTLTLNPRFLKEVDRWSKEEKIKSRSAAIEKLIPSPLSKLFCG
jgi:metal-responsive CopG/Arc/MetJ family transcriptional regulator